MPSQESHSPPAPWARRFFELASEPFAVLGADGRFLEANPAWTPLVGWPVETLKAEGCQGFVHPEDREALEARLAALAERGGQDSLACRWRCQDGTWKWLAWSMSAAPGDAALYCTARAVEPPVPSWSLDDNLPLGLYLVERSTRRIIYANHCFCQLWGIESLEGAIRRGEASHIDVLEHCLRAGEAARFLCLQRQCEGPSGLDEEEAVLANGRTLRHFSTSMGVNGEPERYRLFAFKDVTERKRTEEALRRSEQSFRKLIEQAPDGIFVHREQRFIYVNPTQLKALGYEHPGELIGQSVWRIVHPDDVELVRRRVHTASVLGQLAPPQEVRYVRKDGSWYCVESVGIPVEFDGAAAVVVMSRDVTERKRLQAQLLQSDRMVLAGTLAAGIGHEINNPLTYVMANLDSALETLARVGGAVAETRALLTEALEGASRVRNIVRDLRFISRQEPEERRERVDVTQPLDFALKMAANELRPRARLLKRYEPVPPVYADTSRLGQVFLNLMVNAAQAIPEGNPEGHRVAVHVRPAPSGGVAVEVSDTGSGMPPEVLARIFDPFFTTKPVGSGTGLGLSICHGIIRGLGGDITVQSESGRGTTFTVLLPAAPAGLAEPPPEAPEPPARAPSRRGRVLVVDDEPAVGRSLARILGLRHQVTVVGSGEEALEALASGEPFDAVFCDLMMPGLSGMDVYERTRERAPGVASRFIFITGGSYTARARQFLERVPNRQLEKPFDAPLLHQYLDEVLGLAPSAAPDALG
ncbi:MAG TPA: PAS domain S-box protein [Myxococcus sp.]|nr:PAS domain S-box protein [Myxococcus sp.]